MMENKESAHALLVGAETDTIALENTWHFLAFTVEQMKCIPKILLEKFHRKPGISHKSTKIHEPQCQLQARCNNQNWLQPKSPSTLD